MMPVCRSLLWHIMEFMGCKTISELTAQRSENTVVHLEMQSNVCVALGEVLLAPTPAVRESRAVVAVIVLVLCQLQVEQLGQCLWIIQ